MYFTVKYVRKWHGKSGENLSLLTADEVNNSEVGQANRKPPPEPTLSYTSHKATPLLQIKEILEE